MDVVVEFCCRNACLRSRSAICFSDSAICLSASTSFLSRSVSSSRNLSFSRFRRSTSRSSCRESDCADFAACNCRCWRCEALKHPHGQVFPVRSRPNLQILKDFCDATFTGLNCYAASAKPSIYAAKRLCCGPGEERRDPTKQFYIKLFVFDTAIPAGWSPFAGSKNFQLFILRDSKIQDTIRQCV